MITRPKRLMLLLAAALAVLVLARASARAQEEGEGEEEADPAQVAIGERLFLETRFAQYFFAHSNGNVNAPLAKGDPVVDTTETLAGPIPNPFAGQSMNCRACHFVDDQKATPGGGSRSYSDFARTSPIPAREDGLTHTPRNAPALVNSSLGRGRPFILHLDAEFPTTAALAKGTFTGRNFGWLATERLQAVQHIASVIRGDDGTGALARDFGGSYRVVLAGVDKSIPKDFRLPPNFRLDVDRASDDAILNGVAKLVAAYVESLEFENASPYDRFLEENILPGEAHEGELPQLYVQRLKLLLFGREELEFVSSADGAFALHQQAFVFGPTELEGLRIFLDRSRGNCVACHPPPRFTDFGLHNTGATQEQYDAVHGAGAFAALDIPSLAARAADPDAFLPASGAHPGAHEPFRRPAAPERPGETDLGVWNIFANSDLLNRGGQRRLARLVCASMQAPARCGGSKAALLEASIGLFKTPGLRDLGHSAPYLHTGGKDTLEDVVRFYIGSSAAAKAGQLRNGAPELRQMNISQADVAPLAAFLRALDEDYE